MRGRVVCANGSKKKSRGNGEKNGASASNAVKNQCPYEHFNTFKNSLSRMGVVGTAENNDKGAEDNKADQGQ